MIYNESFCRGTKKKDTPIDLLKREMVVQAVDDYISALKGITVDNIPPDKLKIDCEMFFMGEIFAGICHLNPVWLMNAIKEDVKNETDRFQTKRFYPMCDMS